MTRPHLPLITRPGGHSAKNAHRAGAPNTQPSGENLMVGTIASAAHNAAVREIQQLLLGNAERFVEADHASGAVLVRFTPLAGLVAGLVIRPRAERAALWELLKRSVRLGIELARHNTDLEREWFDQHSAIVRLERDLAELRKERDEIARESGRRQQAIIALTVELDKALDEVPDRGSALSRPDREVAR
ncbi:MAG: hypothetical protein ACJ72N_21055 [Labedaea sp.]